MSGQSIIDNLGITKLINAGGPNTKHSGSRPRPETIRAMKAMSEVFVDMEELLIAAGRRIADLTGNEAATITSGASGGLVVQAAAAMAKDDPERIYQLPITDGIPNELIIQRGHRFIYDHLYLIPGARFVEVGRPTDCTVDELAGAITQNTAGFVHLESPFKEHLGVPLNELVDLAHSHNLPVLADGASMLPPRENLTKYTEQGADLVSFSGGKAIRGPQSTGFLVGKKEWIEYARLNNAPNPVAARAQKVSKEEIAGLLTAIELFTDIDEEAETSKYREQMNFVVDQIVEIPGITAKVVHNYDHYIPHAVIRLNNDWAGHTYEEIAEKMKRTKPRVYIRVDHRPHPDRMWIDPLNLQEGELEIVANKLRTVLIESIDGK
ncbi:MAG: aminotransferase class V-fold PLP-dependent enzyme [SAR202 cluster bacterium]|nr:aminotransferase class V-fold PLP-dependent enzyme [SAR202 cluster bacterium]|tara:strand:- start:177 stop:1316 length:1140 start_codon:yes stop_codon:yes gene_type:complete